MYTIVDTDAAEPISLLFDRHEEPAMLEVVNTTVPTADKPVVHKITVQPYSALSIVIMDYVNDTVPENGKYYYTTIEYQEIS